MPRMQPLTDDEILEVAAKHCEFSGEGTYHLRRYASGWAITQVVRECFELADLCRQAVCAPGCHGSDVESHCELTQSPYCGKTNPAMVKHNSTHGVAGTQGTEQENTDGR